MSEKQVTHEQLVAWLSRLKLPTLAAQLDDVLDVAANRGLTHREFLGMALEREVIDKEARRVSIGARMARFPFRKTLADFDHSAQPSVDPGRVRELGTCRWVAHAENVVLLGPPGVGKTHLAVGLGMAAIDAGHRVTFRTALGLVNELLAAHSEGALEARLKELCKPKVLIIDELGYLPFERDGAHVFFQLISRRYEKGSVIITSNRAVREWGEVFGDAVVATAILDRVLHHSQVLMIRGESYRLKEKRQSGLMKSALSSPQPEQ